MFSLYNGRQKTCEGWSRRELLQVGTLGLGGLNLAGLLSAQARAAAGGPLIRDKAVVLLNLQGGASQLETFDPKTAAPAEYRSMFGAVKTKLPGESFGSHFPGLASMADRLAVVRCLQHGISTHEKAALHVMAGGNASNSNMASVFARIAGTNSPSTGVPRATVIRPPAVGKQYEDLGRRFDEFALNLGSLPPAYRPFDPSAGGEIVQNMKLRIPERTLQDRRALLNRLDSFRRQVDGTDLLRGADRFEQQAFDVIMGGVSDAFSIDDEDPQLIARYDTGMFDVPEWLSKTKSRKESPSPIALGKQMLLARRLVEADCRFVTITSAGWDMHGNRNTFTIDEGMPILGPAVDKAVTAFLEDLEDRGLSEKVLLVILGEFGRTPQISESGGRGHWGDLNSLIFAGGGLPMGQIIGQSDSIAGEPVSDAVTPDSVYATIMNTILDLGELRVTRGLPTEITRHLESSRPIPQLT